MEEFGFVGIKVADTVVGFGSCEDDIRMMVGEARKVGAILLRWHRLYVFAFFGVVELEGVVGAGRDKQLALVVKIKRSDGDIGFGKFEALFRSIVSESYRQ